RFPLGGNHPQEDCMPGSMQYSLCQTYCSTSSTYPMHLLWQSTEIYVYHYGVSVHLYRLLIFRYTFLIASGIYLYQTKDKRFSKAAIAVSYCIGVTYIILNRYVYEFVLFGKWKSTSMFVAFYVFAIMVVLLRRYGNIRKSKFVVMGEASLHVFLMQKVWYGYGFPAVYKMTGSKTDAASLLVWGAINILICFSSGLLFSNWKVLCGGRLFQWYCLNR
ncbi:MAG: hypothetical protein QM271_10345, partial [Bacillota bacterium]|nr:hypothetical protein [Bacillota bacterium]